MLQMPIAFQGGNVPRFSIFFVLGVLAFHQLSWLPGWHWLGVELASCLPLWRLSRRGPHLALLTGFAWSHAFALLTVPPLLPDDAQVMRLVVTGRVVSLPERSQDNLRFVFEADTVEGLSATLRGPWRLRLSWREGPPVRAGDVWRLPVRLRAAHGYANPGSWDREGWLYWQGIRYSGYISADSVPQRLSVAACCRLTQLRSAVSAAVDAVPMSDFARGVVRAITVGDQSGLSTATKDLLRATGTSHLMAISGLHIGLLAGLGLVVFSAVWRRAPALCARVPARVAGAVAGLLCGIVYAALAGMGLPTQRALIMLSVFALGLVLRRETSPLHALAAAAVAVLLWHPASIVAAGFWLSFAAVLAILAALRWGVGDTRWRQAIRVQLAISLVLWPILLGFGMPASGIAPLVNLLLVPLFGLAVVPASLVGAGLLLVLPAAGGATLLAVGGLLDVIHEGLVVAGGLAWPGPGPTASGTLEILLLTLAVALVMAPPGVPLRWMALPVLVLAWLPRLPYPAEGDFVVHLLDVGQGLSTVVETRHRTLVFDTGPEFPSGFTVARAVVLPFLASRGRQRIDRLILSHGDKDHAGGVQHLLAALDVRAVQSGEPGRVGAGARRCVAGERWQWDGVTFEFLHPAAHEQLSGNNASCVLRVSNAAGAILFTGDIERRVERQLARSMAAQLCSRIVVAPHHGSRSSSSDDFVAATRPAYVLYAAGWANRYGFPAQSVDHRWRRSGAVTLNTASEGAISFHFAATGSMSGPESYRRVANRFWRHDSGLAQPSHAVSSGDGLPPPEGCGLPISGG